MRLATFKSFARWIPCLALALAIPAQAQQQTDRQAQQQQRRFQLQLQQVQQQLQEAQAAKARLEAENAELKKSLGERERQAGAAAAAQRQLDQKLRAAESQSSNLASTGAELERKLAEEKAGGAAALAAKDRELAALGQSLRAVEAREGDLQQRFREQVRMVTECSGKNERLVKVGAELIGRYRDKGFAEVMSQRDPVFGLADVATFNLLQQYRDQIDASQFTPSVPR